uniref:G-protein coupled receptors family 1 profile domain-containing protein n=1 Tax=Romanomermis culicivorax TaxID=13658 RepID=A0A915HXW7_ROMCU
MSSLIVALGITYMVLGTIGMTINFSVCLLMGLSKKLKNPTYTYMVNHLVSDMFCLFPISIYTGFCMLIQEKYIERFMSVFVDLGSIARHQPALRGTGGYSVGPCNEMGRRLMSHGRDWDPRIRP